mgnify:CR=1 FL=1
MRRRNVPLCPLSFSRPLAIGALRVGGPSAAMVCQKANCAWWEEDPGLCVVQRIASVLGVVLSSLNARQPILPSRRRGQEEEG